MLSYSSVWYGMVWYGAVPYCQYLGINNVNRCISDFETRVKYRN